MSKVIDEEMHDYFRQLKNINLPEYNNELADAEAEFEKGNYITHEQLLKTIKGW